ERSAGHVAVEGGVAEGDHSTPGGEEPVALPARGRRQAGDRLSRTGWAERRLPEGCGVAVGVDTTGGVDHPVSVSGRCGLDVDGGGGTQCARGVAAADGVAEG